MANDINVGDSRRLLATNIVDAGGAPAAPTTMTLKVKKPDGTVTSYLNGGGTVVEDSPYNYHADIPLDQAGLWLYDWVGTGTAVFAEGGAFFVSPQKTT